MTIRKIFDENSFAKIFDAKLFLELFADVFPAFSHLSLNTIIEKLGHFSLHLKIEGDYLVVNPKFRIILPHESKPFDKDSFKRKMLLLMLQHSFFGVGGVTLYKDQGKFYDALEISNYFSIQWVILPHFVIYPLESNKENTFKVFIEIISQTEQFLPGEFLNHIADHKKLEETALHYQGIKCKIPLNHEKYDKILELTQQFCQTKGKHITKEGIRATIMIISEGYDY